MKHGNLKFRISAILAAILIITSGIFFPKPVFAMSISAAFSHPGTVDEGGSYTVNWSVTGADTTGMTANLTFSVAGASLTGLTTSLGSVNGSKVVLAGIDGITSISGTLTFTVTSDTSVTVSVSGDATSLADFTKVTVSGSSTYSVRSKVQQSADAAEAERLRQENESIANSIAASEAAERERQAAIAASSRAVQESIDASIKAEQESIAASEASSEEEENSKIAESASIENSEKEESLSIEESESESVRKSEEAEASLEASLEASVEASASEVERTKAFELEGLSYVPYHMEEGKFLFASRESEIPELPENYTEVPLLINRQYVFAARTDSLSSHIYLVYGRFEEDAESAFYFYDFENDDFFPYEKLNAGETADSSEETVSEKEDGWKIQLLIAVLAFILGAAVSAFLILLLMGKKKEKETEERITLSEKLTNEALETEDPDVISEEKEADSEEIHTEEAETVETETVEALENSEIPVFETASVFGEIEEVKAAEPETAVTEESWQYEAIPAVEAISAVAEHTDTAPEEDGQISSEIPPAEVIEAEAPDTRPSLETSEELNDDFSALSEAASAVKKTENIPDMPDFETVSFNDQEEESEILVDLTKK